MKKYILCVLFVLPNICKAQVTTTVPPNSTIQFVKDAIERSEAGTAFNLAGNQAAAFYVPIRVLDVPWPNILDGGLGAIKNTRTPEGAAAIRMNFPQLINGIFGTGWFVKNTHGITLPTLFMGPMIKTAWPLNNWTWRQCAWLEVSIPLGSVFK